MHPGHRHYRLTPLLAAVIAAAGLAQSTHAQPTGAPDAAPPTAAQPAGPPAEAPGEQFDGRPIRRVELVRPITRNGSTRLAPMTPRAAEFARNQIRSLSGSAYRQETVSADVSRLSRTGRYGSIEAGVRQESDGSVTLVFTLVEQPIIEDVQSVGNRALSDQDIQRSVDLLVGTPVDLFQLDRGARRIEDLYHAKGYYNAQVDWDRLELEDNGIVLFRITEGEKLKVTGIRFEGVKNVPEGEVRRQVKTKTTFLFTKAPLDDDKLDEDVAAIYNFYRDHGYLDVRVDRRIQPSPNNREAIITFFVEEGPLFHLGAVTLQTPDKSPRFEAAQIASIMPMKRGDVFAINKLRESVDAIKTAFHKEGYSDVIVQTQELRAEDRPVVDLLVQISQGSFQRTGEILTTGNSDTQTKLILGRLDDANVKPGRYLDRTQLTEAEKRLKETRLFDTQIEPPRITPQATNPAPAGEPPPADENAGQPDDGSGQQLDSSPAKADINPAQPDPFDPVYRDVIVEVKETDTGEFNIGAAFNTDSGVVARFSIVQRNFDINDTPDTLSDFLSGKAFRGGGQTLSLEVLPGNRIQTYSLSLSEPSLWDSDYSGSASVYYRNRDYLRYKEERFGTRLGVGRRFGTRWVGNATIRAEAVGLNDIESDQPVDVFKVEDQNLVTGLGFSLVRDTLNDHFRPTRGARTELGIEQVGALGGDFSFTKLSAQHEFFVPVYEDFLGRTTVLSTKISADYIPQSKDDVPVYERYYLGGQSFRGFDYRAISPVGIRNDNGLLGDDPVGGTWSFFLGSQIVHPIFEEVISGVVFIDSGTVTNTIGFTDYRVSAGLGIRLYVPQISPAPIGFDFGFPLVEEPTDKNRVFTFFIDLPF
ncbi:MAG: BamA/TamA family outer membrane protein [Phycisphaerales bacterium]|nr:BamA/TamA family outer membrane protein [Phycisphaerales bacterium]